MASAMAHDLHAWMMDEMQYAASGTDGSRMFTPEDLAQLCVGELRDVWRYLMENVYGPHSIHTIRGNLQLCRGKHFVKPVSSPEKKSLQDRKDSVTKNLRQVNSSIQHLESEIAKLEEEIISKSSAVLERREACRREQRLAACHRLHSERCQAELGATAALTAQLGQLARDRPETGDPHAQPADGQTVCMRQMSEATELLADHIDRSLEQAPTADSLSRAERSIQLTVQRHSPADILRSLAGLQQRAELQLTRRLCQDGGGRGDPTQQPQEAGEEVQRSREPPTDGDPVTEKIQRSVDELHALHVTWRVTEITAEREARRLRQQLHQLTDQLLDGQQEVGPVDWAAHLAAAEAQGRAVAMETAVRQLTAEGDALGEARAALEERYAAIQRNQQLIERNKSHIQLLVSLAGDSLVLVRSAQQRAAATAQRQLTPLLTQLLAAQQRLASEVSTEAEAVSRRLLADLRWLLLDGRPVLSAHLPLYRAPAPSDRALMLPRRLNSVEAQLTALLETQWEGQRAACGAETLRQLGQALGQAGATAEQLEECRRRVQSQTEHERTALMPQLEKLFVNMSQMGAALKEARTALHNWTDQPARAAVQQVQHAGQTLRQWEQRYLAAVADGRAGPAGRRRHTHT